jgi:hypothetical protein
LADPIITPERIIAITHEGGNMRERFLRWCERITSTVNNNTSLTGSGSPEGVETGSPGRIYFDTDTDTQYYKKTGDGNTGWQAL